MRKFKLIASIFIAFFLTFSIAAPAIPVAAAGQTMGEASNLADINKAITLAVEKVKQTGVVSEWQAIGIARSGAEVPSSYYENYFLTNLNSQILNASRVKITDIERLVIAAVALGKDPTNINEKNLVEKIYNSADWTAGNDSMTAQGINGPIYGLIALDSQNFAIPSDARWTKEKLLTEIVSRQNADGSWSLFGTSPSYDITAMALIALAPYNTQAGVKSAIDRAVKFLSAKQGQDGGYSDPFVGGVSSEATSQVIIGLTSNGIDPTSTDFTKNGNNLISHLFSFQYTDGGFKHILSQTKSDNMATEQALQALVAYKLFLEGKGKLYQFPKKITEKPTITVVGLTNNQIVNENGLSFTVAVKDGEGKAIGHSIIVNNQALPVNGEGKYSIQLSEGINTITISAIDEWNNNAIQSYQVTYKKAEKDDQNVPPAGNGEDNNQSGNNGQDHSDNSNLNNGTTPDNTPGNSVEKGTADNATGTTVEKGTVDTGSTTGKNLPDTASQQWNLIFLGTVLSILGAALYYFRGYKVKMNK